MNIDPAAEFSRIRLLLSPATQGQISARLSQWQRWQKVAARKSVASLPPLARRAGATPRPLNPLYFRLS